jgi:hypothetical protein
MKTVSIDSQRSLVQWVSQATGINTFGVKVRLLGNDLHILCEGIECPQRWHTLSELLHALQHTDLDELTSEEQPSIYQVFVYGRKKGEYRPQWCHKVYLNQLDRHLEQVEQLLLADAEQSKQPGGALIVSNESLARQGNPDAIARYLSENLSNLGVAVKVQIKPHKSKANSESSSNRLWILCQASYSPDPSLLAEPVAQHLRHLKLKGYEDAVIVAQVRGENEPDWRLRIDLTPPEAMLKEWARWGDVQAIARLLNELLSDLKIAVQVSLKESTLHLFCSPAFDPLETAEAPTKDVCLETILPQLEAIAPQGILAATIYGQKTSEKQPNWVDWQSLPASQHPALATPALELATAGDEPAIIFLLERLLNHDLDWRLKTGGLRVLLLRKGDLLHIMCDAPNCPARHQVAHKVIQFIRQLKIPNLHGVRVYGRRAGNKEPLWNQGADFAQRPRLVPEPAPEFAVASEYISAILNNETEEPVLRPDLTGEDVKNVVTEFAENSLNTLRNWLFSSQIFTEVNQSTDQTPDEQGIKGGFIWIALGLLLTLQSDWMMGFVITRTLPHSSPAGSVSAKSHSSSDNQSAQTPLNHTSADDTKAFNASGFIQDDQSEKSPLQQKATATAILLAARSQIPSFNARQLDEQLALYKQRLAKTGKPPDVLIIGSSRALRGVDPVALNQALATQGYANVEIFNFGINGATAQVVDFIIRYVLEPTELPKLILFADGSRAFNSGREDITFNAIAVSKGYKQVLAKAEQAATDNQPSTPTTEPDTSTTTQPVKPELNIYQVANETINQGLTSLSTTYQNRNYLKGILQKQLQNLPFATNQSIANVQPATEADPDSGQLAVDFDGFLPISIRFNPTTYYQKHPRVAGSYDNDYKDFALSGKQDSAIKSLLQFTQSRKIPLVFVNMPLTSDYLDPVRRKYEQEFQQYMLQLANQPNFIYRDLSLLWPSANENFSDPSHLNRYGAYEVSKKLATDSLIPWPVK